MTLVVAALAGGHKCPPFFIIQGVNVMENLIAPFHIPKLPQNAPPELHRLTEPKWFEEMSCGGAIYTSENRSMDSRCLLLFMENLNIVVRKQSPQEKHFLLTLDNHGSRKEVEWVEKAESINAEVVLLPANTTHFLQSCDKYINKKFKSEMRNVRDKLATYGFIDHRQISFRLACAIIA